MYSQNVQGLKIEMKEEYLVRIIKTRKLVAFTVQERHLTGDYVKIIGEKKILHDTSQARRTAKMQ